MSDIECYLLEGLGKWMSSEKRLDVNKRPVWASRWRQDILNKIDSTPTCQCTGLRTFLDTSGKQFALFRRGGSDSPAHASVARDNGRRNTIIFNNAMDIIIRASLLFQKRDVVVSRNCSV